MKTLGTQVNNRWTLDERQRNTKEYLLSKGVQKDAKMKQKGSPKFTKGMTKGRQRDGKDTPKEHQKNAKTKQKEPSLKITRWVNT